MAKVRLIITNAQNIFHKDTATKEELEQAIQALKILLNAPADSVGKIVWVENQDTNQKLLTVLEAKLTKLNEKVADKPLNSDTTSSNGTKKGADKSKPTFNSNKSENVTNSNNELQQDQTTIKNNLNNDINQAQNGTDDDKVNAIKNLGKIHGEEGYKEQEKKVKILEEELMENNPQKYLEGVQGAIEENMKKNNLSREELDAEIQTEYKNLSSFNIKKIKEVKDKINENIGQIGAKKRFRKLKARISKISKSSKEKNKKLKEKITRFINSSNKYNRVYKKESQYLLSQLDAYQTQKSSISTNFLTGLVVGGGVLAMVGLIAILIIKKKGKKNKSKY